MSFSSDVKREITRLAPIYPSGRRRRVAEIAAIINTRGRAVVTGEGLRVVITANDGFILAKALTIASRDFGARLAETGQKNRVEIGPDAAGKILSAAGLDSGIPRVSPLVIKSRSCRMAFLRLIFLTNGSVSHPSKGYHLEFVFKNEAFAEEISSAINFFGLNSKIIKRKSNFVAYVKGGDHVVGFLSVIGARLSLLSFENARIGKEVSNNINRQVNFQSANLNKTISASVGRVADIELIMRTRGFSRFSPNLEQIARLRLENPEMSLTELGGLLNPPMSKSGAGHRLKKLSKIADDIRNGEYGGERK